MIHQETYPVKITRPNPKNIYRREKFFKILDKCRKKPLIWLYAPPGTGKTALISSYIESRKLQCLWYEVDSNDRDPATFFHYMGIAATKIGSKKRNPLPHLTPEYLLGLPVFSRNFFSELYKTFKKESIIVFDNYQETSIESILHELIHEELSNMPENINIIIISRAVPPPIISRMRLSQLMEIITWDELRLTAEEVRGITLQRGMKDSTDKEIRKLMAKTDGWVAGLVLILESENTENFSAEPIDSHNSASVFDYFASEFFQKFSYDTQDFLLKSSVFPTMTSDMAEELTGNSRAAHIISELVHKNYFIQSHAADQVRYQYHPLFREFLYTCLKEESNPDDLINIERRAAKLLANSGYIDDAIRLFIRVCDWDSLASLICREASTMLEHGRHKTLEGWLDHLPESVLEETPWLIFFKASCHLPFDQGKSRLFFEKAFEIFYDKKDVQGIFLSWSGIIDAIIYGFDDFKPLDRWISLLDDILKEYPSFPSKEIEIRVSLFMFLALSFRAPQHPDISHWVDKTYSFLNELSDINVLAQVSLCLVDYFVWIGDMEKANLIVANLTKKARSESCTPMALLSIKLTESLNNWYRGKLRPCIVTVSDGLKTAETKGVKVFNYFLYGHGAIASLTDGDLAGAEDYLKKANSVLDEKKRFCTSYYHHIAACYKLLKNDLAGALEHEKLALGLAIEVGAPFAEAMSRTGIALLRYELGEQQSAIKEITSARKLAIKTGSRLIEFVCYLFEAYFALDKGDKNLAIKRLRKALALGSKKGFVNFHMWNPRIIARLCVLALEQGLEVDYVTRLIRERDLFLDGAPLEVNTWPWRLKIHILGKFIIIKDGTPIEFSRKAPKKSIDMLKMLIALGGKDVPAEKISDALWEDAEGDDAHVAFTTTLKRLRQLIDLDDVLQLRNGCLSLNPRYCWVDVWRFEYLINKGKVFSAENINDISVSLIEKAVKIYGDGFNLKLDEHPLEVLFYERLRNKFILCVIKLGSYWEQCGKIKKAIEYYKKGIEIEGLSEELYQKLMLCLNRHGQSAEALYQYNRMATVFSKVLGIEPSAETKNLYESFTPVNTLKLRFKRS